MENDFILTSTEFAKITGISNESLRSRRRRGLYQDQYTLKNKSYRWKRPRPNQVREPLVRDAGRLAANASSTNSISRLLPQPRRRNKNSGRHKHGARTFYPNKAFELANEFKMVLKSQRRIAAAAAEEITPDLIKLAEEKHREKVLKKCEPVTVTKNYGGLFNPRYSIPNYKPIKYQDEIEDAEREFWSKKPYY
jgi:hypothetical protein